ncbi:MAG: DJ-1/PfpI family protein, partial [Pseudoalteromonas prydzensis]
MNIAIYIYDDAEVLDFSGPFEVFSTAKRLADNNWQVFFVAEHAGPIIARAGFSVNPH